MHCPFTSEISVERKHILSITVMRYFYFLMSVITSIGKTVAGMRQFLELNFSVSSMRFDLASGLFDVEIT